MGCLVRVWHGTVLLLLLMVGWAGLPPGKLHERSLEASSIVVHTILLCMEYVRYFIGNKFHADHMVRSSISNGAITIASAGYW